MKVPKRYLLAIAGAVWGVAGFNIARLGILAYGGYVKVINVVLSVVVFLLFQFLIFGKMVEKHTKRIVGYEENMQFFLKFFDVKAFCIMAFMMTFGIGLRMSSFCPDIFIAVFYTGLGSSLLLAGILFFRKFYVFELPEQ